MLILSHILEISFMISSLAEGRRGQNYALTNMFNRNKVDPKKSFLTPIFWSQISNSVVFLNFYFNLKYFINLELVLTILILPT